MTEVVTPDTPIPQPPSKLEQAKGFIGDLARPFSIISTSGAAAWATVAIVDKVKDPSFEGAAIYIGAVFAGLAALYGFKAWESVKAGGQVADVKVARAAGSQPVPPADNGELPPDQRVQP